MRDKILAALAAGPVHVDDLGKVCGAVDVRGPLYHELMVMELEGVITRLPGSRYRLRPADRKGGPSNG